MTTRAPLGATERAAVPLQTRSRLPKHTYVCQKREAKRTQLAMNCGAVTHSCLKIGNRLRMIEIDE